MLSKWGLQLQCHGTNVAESLSVNRNGRLLVALTKNTLDLQHYLAFLHGCNGQKVFFSFDYLFSIGFIYLLVSIRLR